ncbi:MAG: DinB family protein [Dehalococcoidia bacterium]
MTDDETTGYADERRRLMVVLERERNQLIRNIETCRIRDIDRPFIGEWSLKDIVGHISSWEAEVVVSIRQVRDGQSPDLLRFAPSRVPEWNADHVERKRSLHFWDLFQQLQAGRKRLLEEVAQLTDEQIGADGAVAGLLLQATLDHDRHHWHDIAAKLAGMAGARAAERASIPAETAAASEERAN